MPGVDLAVLRLGWTPTWRTQGSETPQKDRGLSEGSF